jgi:hypothetical protein
MRNLLGGALLVLAALTATSVGGGASAQSSEEQPIDCSDTAFAFSGEGFFVDCVRVSGRASKEGSSGETEVDLITISSESRSMFLTLRSVKLTATRLYIRRTDLRENTRDFFSRLEMNDWKGLGYKSGYDMAEFSADISGQPSRCLALQRYMNPMQDGFKRHVIGIGCASGSLDSVYDALAKLRAPGD